MPAIMDPVKWTSREYKAHAAFWRERLAPVTEVFALEVDMTDGGELRPRTHGFALESELGRELDALAMGRDLGLFAILLSGWKLLLRNYRKTRFTLVKTPALRAGDEDLPCEVFLCHEWDPAASLKSLLRELGKTIASAYRYQAYPLERVLSKEQRSRLASCRSHVSFSGLHAEPPESDLAGLAVSFARGADGRIEVSLTYDGSAFSRAFIEAVCGHYRTVLTAFRDPDRPIRDVPILSPAARAALLDRFAPRPKLAADGTIQAMFEAAAAAYPGEPAVIFEDRTLTYDELNRAANRLAHYLRRVYLVKPNDSVAVLAGTSERLIVALLGILKAGAGYVPIDTRHPASRIERMLERAGAKALLTESAWMYEVETELPLFALDLQLARLKDSDENPEPRNHSHDLAYTLFTSGSSGEPKGVMVPHRGVVNLIEAQAEAFAIELGKRVLQFASIGFDASVSEIFVTLGKGATLILADRDRLMPGPEMIALCRDLCPDVATLPPAVLACLEPEDFPDLTTVVSAGDACSRDLARAWSRKRRFLNAYGPTEATVCATIAAVAEDVLGDPPIGRPMDGASVYVLDPELALRPCGIAGEIFIGGRGLAWGYLGDPGQSACRFLPHPFVDEPGARLYRSGDRARMDEPGSLYFLGRGDRQVKIRGYRVELEEVAAACRRHPTVRDAHVEVGPDGASLAAYLIPEPRYAPAVEGHERYMLPNGMAVVHHRKGETDFIYDEIFEQAVYLRGGIAIEDGACIVDVGGNIGLFSLFARHIAKDTRVYSFEPLPPTFELLRINAQLYGPGIRVFPQGLSNQPGEAQFTFYPQYSGGSGRYADRAEEEHILRTLIRNREAREGAMDEAHVEELVADRFRRETHRCSLTTLSRVIAEQGIERIDLLKIDVEKSEWDVLEGIDSDDWPRIRQIAMEVHDLDGRLARVVDLLSEKGFQTTVEQDRLLEGTTLFSVFATRRKTSEHTERPSPPRFPGPALFSPRDLAESLRARLPDYMIPSRYRVLESFPLNENGKIDRASLPAPEPVSGDSPESGDGPRTPTEARLAAIWSEVLKVPEASISPGRHFFEMGGHSLLATQIISRVREHWNVALPLRSLFAAPTLRAFGQVVDERARTSPGEAMPPLVRRSGDSGGSPLSFSQQRLWVLNRLEPDNPFYNVPFVFQVTGKLDARVLDAVLQEILRRHEVLRTAFTMTGERPRQTASEGRPHPLRFVDLRGLPAESRAVERERLTRRETRASFDLSRPPLVRWLLLKQEDQAQRVLLTIHHIAADGWSVGVLVREIAALYRAFLDGSPSPLPSLPFQYADYAAWQRAWLDEAALAAKLAYWRGQLAGLPPRQDLPLDRPRPETQTYAGAQLGTTLPPTLSDGLRKLAGERKATLFMVLLAALKTLLLRHTGRTDCCVGTVVAGRIRAELEDMIGYFLNNLALRTDLSGDPSFLDLLDRVREVTLQGFAHQEIPFETVLDALKLERDLSATPLFQVMLIVQNAPMDKLSLPGVRFSPATVGAGIAKFDLTVTATETPRGIHVNWNYNTDLFSESTICGLLAQYEHLLGRIAAEPQSPLSRLALEDRSAQRQTMERARAANFRLDRAPVFEPQTLTGSVPDRFAAIARIHAVRPAVVTAEGSLSYDALHRLVNRVAHGLLARVGRTNRTIALLFGQEGAMIAAVLGTLAAGHTYVPLDPNLPVARLRAILADSEPAAVLAGPNQREAGAAFACDARPTLDFEALIAEAADTPPEISVTPETPAYFLYTSGSSGTPKGVVQNHGNLSYFIERYINNLCIGPEDRLSLLATYTFDAALMDLFGALLSGAALAPMDIRAEGLAGFADWLRRERITVYHSVPTVFRAFVRHQPDRAGFPDLRLVVLGGEAVYPNDIDRFRRVFSETCVLVNGFGPTESTLALQYFVKPGEDLPAGNAVPIGYPVEGTEVVLLNPSGAEIGGCGSGEIALKSRHVALGYLGKPEETAAAFTDADEPGGPRLYRTGDLGRRHPDGFYTYVGRKDFQAKIHGHRVELTEIEIRLRELDGVREAAVRYWPHEDGGKLAAYVVLDGGPAPEAAAARERLGQALPEYMIPTHFQILETMPLTATGKLDRGSLPEPATAAAPTPSRGEAPRTETERALAEIWTELLSRPAIGRDDSFFALGGDSLKAIQAIFKIRERFLVELPLRKLFEAPTLAELAAAVERHQHEDEDAQLMAALLDDLESSPQEPENP